ncbi:Uncharacterised protein [Mycobacteroides abscessus subsp. abscessus]|nr:Uncharacterised protein [Mycobacteroides abscessus subsp. abscessus]
MSLTSAISVASRPTSSQDPASQPSTHNDVTADSAEATAPPLRPSCTTRHNASRQASMRSAYTAALATRTVASGSWW